MDHQVNNVTGTEGEEKTKVLLATYAEICKSYHAIDDFRMKLLGLLPLASLVGIFLLDTDKLLSDESIISNELLGFAAIFAAALTLSLFGYEIRGIQRCDRLITEGEHLEKELGIKHGQFYICVSEHSNPSHVVAKTFNTKLVACVIYSVVFAAWLFLALRLGFGIDTLSCSISAIVTGLLVAVGMYLLVRKLIPA
jgi:hypothetical protein